MKGDDGKPAPRFQQTLGGGEAAGEFVELLVEIKPQALKSAGGGVLLLLACEPEDAGDDIGELRGGRDRRLGATLDDGLGDGARTPLLAELEENIGKLLFAQTC